MTISPRRAKKKTVGVSGAGIVGLRSCSARGVPFTSGASPLARHVERTQADVVIGIGPVAALGLTGLGPKAIDLRGVAIVDADIPVGQDVSPLQPRPVIEPIGGRRFSIARRSQEQVQRQRIVEAVAVINDARAEERLAMDVVRLERRAEILVLTRGATCSD